MKKYFFRFANTFYNWDSFIVMMDDSLEDDIEDSIYQILAVDASISIFKLPKGY